MSFLVNQMKIQVDLGAVPLLPTCDDAMLSHFKDGTTTRPSQVHSPT